MYTQPPSSYVPQSANLQQRVLTADSGAVLPLPPGRVISGGLSPTQQRVLTADSGAVLPLPPGRVISGGLSPTYSQYGALDKRVTSPVGSVFTLSNSVKWRNAFAWGFTFVLFALYSAPTVIAVRLGFDTDNVYWIGRLGLFVLAMPVFFVMQHLAHIYWLQTRGAPKSSILLWCVLGPALVFCLIGGVYKVNGSFLYGQLGKENCAGGRAIPEMRRLDQAYGEALGIYNACWARLISLNGGLPLPQKPLLQECSEWAVAEDMSNLKPWKGYETSYSLRTANLWGHEWSYLASSETNHFCGGFCVAGQQLWSGLSTETDACGPLIARKMLNVEYQGNLLLGVGLITIVVAIPTFLKLRPMMQHLGYE